ncbi:MAG: palindromic element RPE2 domain-containing protein [Candidatus Tisiphia sp.]|nr:palindromic element RPE2 domain-containing protein [Rickettsia endosymbiont of Culicoides newsteadi]MDN3030511.1 palindromic element RPE2 domain-containing protein [Candidatus Tisiphia sp.]
MVNSGEFGARKDGATPISNRRALSDDVTNFSSIDYIMNNFANNLILSISVKDFIDIIKILPVKH